MIGITNHENKSDNDPEQENLQSIGWEIVRWEFFSSIAGQWHNKARERYFQIYKAQELYNPDILLEKFTWTHRQTRGEWK